MVKPEVLTKTKKSGTNKTRQKILDVSATLFSHKGYNGTSLRDIAVAADMKAGSIYHHFDSKEQLIREVLTTGIDNIYQYTTREVNALPENSSTRAIIDAAARGHLEALLEKCDYSSTSIRNFRQLPEASQIVVLELRDKYEKLWHQWLKEGQEKGEIKPEVNLKILRLTILSALTKTLEWYKEGELSTEEIAGMQISFFWNGVDGKNGT